MKKLFGTDGVRGVANVYPMTTEMAMQIGRAAAYHFQERQQKASHRHRQGYPAVRLHDRKCPRLPESVPWALMFCLSARCRHPALPT